MTKTNIIALILGLVVVSGSVFFYGNQPKSPGEILDKSWAKIQSSEFLGQKIKASVVIEDEDIKKENGLVSPKINLLIDQKMATEKYIDPSKDLPSSSKLEFTVENFMGFSGGLKADLITEGSLLFFLKLSEVTGAPVDTSSITNTWWKIDLEALIRNFAGEEADKILESINSTQLSKDKIEEIKVIAEKYESKVNLTAMVDGDIEGMPAYHFTAAIDKVALKDLIMEILDVVYGEGASEEKAEVADIESMLAQVNIKSFEILVAKGTYATEEFRFYLDILKEDSKVLASVDASIIISAIGPITIEAPTESTDILEFFGGLMGGMAPGGIPSFIE